MFPLSPRRRRLLLFFSLFLLALIPRLSAIGRYVTPDELNWVYRSVGLRQALLAREWAGTLRSGHPGVTTTWLGAVSIQIQLWLQPAVAGDLAWLDTLYWLGSDSVDAYRRLAPFLSGGRVAIALVTSLGVGGFYLLAETLVGARAALLGAVLVALDPFAAGLSGLLHVDGLLATFMILALLLALQVRQAEHPPWAATLATGIFTALALLTKTPAVLLLPLVGLILFPRPFPAGQREALFTLKAWMPLLIWLLTVGVTSLLLLPALWSAPRAAFETLTGLTGRLVGEAVRPSFFLGEMEFEHGPLFYPVAVLFRLSPAVTVGLLFLTVAALRSRRGVAMVRWRAVGWFAVFSLLFLLLVTVVAKKHDRYALPALMALNLVAGWAIAMATGRTAAWIRHAAFFFPLLLQLAFLLAALPYPLTAYNWLAGGRERAYRVLPAGWGEGASVAAQQLATMTEEQEQPALFTNSPVSTAPFYDGEIYRRRPAFLTLLEADDSLLVTAGERQSPAEGGIETALQQREAEATVMVNGQVQARLYSGVAAADLGLPSLEISGRSYHFDRGPEIVAGGAAFLSWPWETLLAIEWQVPQGTAAGGYHLQLEIVDGEGQRRASQEQPLLNGNNQPPAAWPAGRPQRVFYTLPIPPDLPPGHYRVVAHLFDDQGAELGVFDAQGHFAGTGAPVSEITVTPPASQPLLAIPRRDAGQMQLVGYAPLPATVANGAPLVLDLWWQTMEPGRYQLALALVEDGPAIQPWPLDTRNWTPGQRYNIRPIWRLPADLPGGRHPLRLQLLDAGGSALWPAPLTLGEVEVEVQERNFALPDGVEPLGIEAGALAFVQDVALEREGETLHINVLWQARQETETAYTVFVHLLDGAGNVVDQVDRPPSPPTTSWVPQQVIGDSYTLPLPVTSGNYQIALGLYEAGSGQRLPLYAAGERLADDRYLRALPAH